MKVKSNLLQKHNYEVSTNNSKVCDLLLYSLLQLSQQSDRGLEDSRCICFLSICLQIPSDVIVSYYKCSLHNRRLLRLFQPNPLLSGRSRLHIVRLYAGLLRLECAYILISLFCTSFLQIYDDFVLPNKQCAVHDRRLF